jgi:MYXO-CTERM domain-containing protein
MSYAHSVVKFPGSPPDSAPSSSPSRAAGLARRGALLFALIVAVISLFGAPAAAQNRVVWKQTKIKETDKSWKVAIEVYLDRAPDVAHMPVRFSFTPISYFERAMVDGKKEAVAHQIPLSNQQPIVESVDVGFLDPGTGKSAKRTRFSFHVTRDRGFEAGIYEVVVTDARSDREFGGKTTLTLDGENDVIDRRSMVFDDKPKPKKEGAAKAESKERELTPDDEAYWSGGPKQPEEKQAALPPPAHMQERPGCGCRMQGPASAAPGWGLAGLALGLFARRGRRQARARFALR